MSRRPDNDFGTHPSTNDIPGSFLDADSDKPAVKLPIGLDPAVRKLAKTVLENNPFLRQAQLDTVLRYCDLMLQYKQLQKQVSEQGVISVDRFGVEQVSATFKAQNSVHRVLVALERSLAIAVPTRREQISKSEEKPRTRTNGPKTKGGGGMPKLRLA